MVRWTEAAYKNYMSRQAKVHQTTKKTKKTKSKPVKKSYYIKKKRVCKLCEEDIETAVIVPMPNNNTYCDNCFGCVGWDINPY